MKKILFLLPLSVLFSCQPKFEEEVTISEIQEHIAFLASDELKGRYPGTPEDLELAGYLATEFKKAGLQLYEKTGVQHFDIVQEIEAGPDNRFLLGESTLGPVGRIWGFAGFGLLYFLFQPLWNSRS